MKITMKNKTLERIKLILEFIEKKIKSEPKKETFEFPLREIEKIPLLNDTIGLSQAFKKIQKETKENVLIDIYDPSYESEDPVFRDRKIRIKKPPAVIFHLENIEEFNKYKRRIEQELEKGDIIPSLTLTYRGDLYRTNDKGRKLVYPMVQNSLRCKILHYLAQEKRRVSAKELAEEFGKAPQEIRKAIGEIKKLIKERLKIPGDEIIESSDKGGYKVQNVKLKEN
jgi:hypothetical protein